MTPSEAALLAACRGDVTAIEGSNWREVLAKAQMFEVEAIVAHNLRSHLAGSPRLSSRRTELYDEVERLHGAAVIQQGLQDAEMGAVLGAMNEIPTLVLKGPGISARYYPRAVRLSRDLDLHVHHSDYVAARSALQTLGYRVSPDYDEHLQLRQAKDVPFTRRDSSGKSWFVELHWRLSAPPAPTPSLARIWSEAQWITYSGGRFLAASDKHTLLLLALNLRKQRFARLKTICDVRQLLEVTGPSINWRALHDEAHELGYCALVRHSLALTHQLLGGPCYTLPSCARKHSPTTFILRHIAGPDAVLSEARPDDNARLLKAFIPFFSLDKLSSSLHLVVGRLMLSPELASYHTSSTTHLYKSRSHYWKETGTQLLQALRALTRNTPPFSDVKSALPGRRQPTNRKSIDTRTANKELS